MENMKYIPQIEPWIDGRELEQLTQVIQSTFITENRKTDEFLELIRGYTGAPHAAAFSNGTVALLSCLLSEGIGQGDEVIIPDLTFIATANVVHLAGATPVFCDVQRDTGCMDPESCGSHITLRTKAIIPVHLYGQSTDMPKLLELAKNHNLCIIEDAAESFGVKLNGVHTGTFGKYGVFSFFANKTITCGEGGAVITNSEKRYRQLYRIKNHGRNKKGIFIHDEIGYNFCFTDLQAAIGIAQFSKLDAIMEAKQANFKFYSEHLYDIDGLEMVKIPDHVNSNYWFVNILVEDPEALASYLNNVNIGTRRYFYPLHKQPCYPDISDGDFKNSNWLYDHGLSLPSSARLNNQQRELICQKIRTYFVC